jgi:hypothetical protein
MIESPDRFSQTGTQSAFSAESKSVFRNAAFT